MWSYWEENPNENLQKIKYPKAIDINKKHILEGHVEKVSRKKFMTKRIFECLSCGAILKQPQYSSIIEAFNSTFKLVRPISCYKEQNGCNRKKSSTRFTLLPQQSEDKIYEEIKIKPLADSRYIIKCLLVADS